MRAGLLRAGLHASTSVLLIPLFQSWDALRGTLVLAALAEGMTTIDGRGRLRDRPMAPLIETLRSQDVSIRADRGLLPATVVGRGGLWGGSLTVDGSQTSQFATALMLAAPLTRQPMVLRVDRIEGSAGYLDMTAAVIGAFGGEVTPTITGFDLGNDGYQPADYLVEPDASAAVYPMVAAAITGGRVEIEGLSPGSLQPDIVVAEHLVEMGCTTTERESGVVLDASGVELSGIDADMSPAPDGALALAVAALFATGPSRIRGLGSLRYKESDRLAAMTSEISRMGGSVLVEDDALSIRPTPLHPAIIDPHGDHRIAMSLSLVGLRIEGVEVAQPGVVEKTWPGFWEMLAIIAAR